MSTMVICRLWNSPLLRISQMNDWDCLTKQIVPIVKRSWLSESGSEKSIALSIYDKKKRADGGVEDLPQ